MTKLFIATLLLFSVFGTFGAFIVPQEIPSLLSLVYSNIPPIRKGTDSRIGFGYRLGDHADFQVQFEIGPQKDTKAIGTSSSSKREVNSAENAHFEQSADRESVRIKNSLKSSESGSWLQNWFKELQKNNEKPKTKPTTPSSSISEAAFSQLQQLYHPVNNSSDDTETPKSPEI